MILTSKHARRLMYDGLDLRNIVQETYFRWLQFNRPEGVRDPRAYLSRDPLLKQERRPGGQTERVQDFGDDAGLNNGGNDLEGTPTEERLAAIVVRPYTSPE